MGQSTHRGCIRLPRGPSPGPRHGLAPSHLGFLPARDSASIRRESKSVEAQTSLRQAMLLLTCQHVPQNHGAFMIEQPAVHRYQRLASGAKKTAAQWSVAGSTARGCIGQSSHRPSAVSTPAMTLTTIWGCRMNRRAFFIGTIIPERDKGYDGKKRSGAQPVACRRSPPAGRGRGCSDRTAIDRRPGLLQRPL